MNSPKVSVLISFYNLAPYVDQTMESVLAQKTDFPVEILCADDGSDDGTVEKLHNWCSRCPDTIRMFIMERKPGLKVDNRGRIQRLNAIRSRLLEEARGEYICYLDGDDFIQIPTSCRSKRIFWMQIPRKSMLPAAITAVSIGKVQEKRDPLKSPSGNAA